MTLLIEIYKNIKVKIFINDCNIYLFMFKAHPYRTTSQTNITHYPPVKTQWTSGKFVYPNF